MSLLAPPPAPGDPLYAVSPAWLEFSGLPEFLHAVRKNSWVIFKKLVELDCERHPARPGVVVVSPGEVGLRTGFDAEAVHKAVDGFRRKKLVRVFLPEHALDDMLYEIAAPLPVPASAEEIARAMEARFGTLGAVAPRRYAFAPDQGPAGSAEHEERLRRAVEAYMTHLSLSVNSFVVDELAMLARRYDPELIEAAMRSAAAADERHVSAVYRRLKVARRDDEQGA